MNKILTIVLLCSAGPAQAGEITLYTRANFGGPAISLHESAPDLNKLGFNDRTSSVIVRSGTWEVCEDIHYKGKCLILEKGEYPVLKNFNDVMSSVREIEPKGKREAGPAHASLMPPPLQRHLALN